ncbi:MAG: ATP-dependent Clp protease proteolytic subunit [Spirochaetaceae bacterium]|nr:ATP-dependent Clp protease proteolytic subunit [Spirochaetaceae bacterium]
MIDCDEKKEKKPGPDISEKLLQTRQIVLSGEINKELAEKIVKQLFLMEAESHEPIYIFIDSPGGDADSGFAVFDMIRFVDAPVYTIGMGLVASAASLILLAADKDKRLALPNSHFLIHQPLSGIKGVATAIEIHAQEVEKLRKKINELIVEETGKSLEEVEKHTDRDYWLNAEEAKDYGLVDRIIESRKDL